MKTVIELGAFHTKRDPEWLTPPEVHILCIIRQN